MDVFVHRAFLAHNLAVRGSIAMPKSAAETARESLSADAIRAFVRCKTGKFRGFEFAGSQGSNGKAPQLLTNVVVQHGLTLMPML